jgi:GH24 family phage-related lysozyme (muramidase)
MADIQASIDTAVAFAKKWEGLYSGSPSSKKKVSDSASLNTPIYAYYDSLGGVWTIGWGNTYYSDGSKVRQGDKITNGEADDMITWEMTQKESEVSKFVDSSNLTNNEYAALLSFAYNAGSYGLKKTAIDESLKNKSRQETANIIKDSVLTAGGNYSQGLKNRRIDESKLFLGEYNELYSLYLRNSGSVNVATIGILLIVITLYLRRRFKK